MEKWALYDENVNNAIFLSICDVITKHQNFAMIALIFPFHFRLEIKPMRIMSLFSVKLEGNIKPDFKYLFNILFSHNIDFSIFKQIANAIADRMQETESLIQSFLTLKSVTSKWKTNIFKDRMEILADEISNILYKYVSARLIQRSWRRAISDPQYQVCRRRLERELRDLTNI